MYIKNLEDFKEYEPYCDVCWSEFNDIQELHLEGHCQGEGLRLCVNCRKKLNELITSTISYEVEKKEEI